MDWKDSFNRNVLMQGWRRFQNHEMGPIMKNGNTYFVQSPEGYQTRAVIDNGYVDSISCSCFRGRRGELCEHEAALLFGLENNAASSRKAPNTPSASRSEENRQIPHPNAYSRPEAAPFGKTSRPIQETPQASRFHPDRPAESKAAASPSEDPAFDNPLLDELQKLFGLENPACAPVHPHEQVPKEKPSTFEQPEAGFERPETKFESSALHPQEKSVDRPFDPWSTRVRPESVLPEDVREKPQRPAPEKPAERPEDEFIDPFERWMNAAREAQNQQNTKKPESLHPQPQKQPEQSTFKAPERENRPHPSWFWDPFHPDAKSPFAVQPETQQEAVAASEQPKEMASVTPTQPGASDSSYAKTTHPAAESVNAKFQQPQQPGQPAAEEKKPEDDKAPLTEQSPAPRLGTHEFTAPAVKVKPENNPELTKEETPAAASSKEEVPKADTSNAAPANIKSDQPYDFEALLQKLSTGDLATLLNTYGKVHPEFQDFILAGSLETNPDAIGLILEEAHVRLKACLLKDGSFQEREASRKAKAFLSWLDDQLLALFASRQDASASDLLRNILNDLNESVRLDDELEADFLVHEIFSRLDHLLSGAPALVVKDTFSWIEDHLASPGRTIIDLPMLRLIEKPYFNRDDLALLKLNLLTKVLDQADDYVLSTVDRHKIVNTILELVDTFPQLEQEQATVTFMQTYGSAPQALLKKAHQAIAHNRPGLAEVQLKKARAHTLSNSQEEEVCRLLIQIYQIEDQPDLAVRQLKELIFVLDAADPDDLVLLKKLESDDEWAEDLKKLETTASPELLILVYDRLHMDDKLLRALEKEPHIHDLIDYEDRLIAVDPDRMARLWLNTAHSIADQANERHDYHRLAAALRKAADHPSTHDEALQFAAELKEMNHRRKALLQELHHAGF